ncbi:MAG: hypothetical protein ACRCWF_13925 [Beijerinckiaceae bacterium]
MKHQGISCALLALVALTPVSASAQTPPAAKAGSVTCPATLEITYKKIDRLPFDGKEFDIAGFTQRFAPVNARLIGALVAPEATMKDSRTSDMPDNADTAKPGQPLIYTVWSKDEKAPAYAAFARCEYEGGYLLQQALPATTRSCAVATVNRKPAATDTSTREYHTSAVITCQ